MQRKVFFLSCNLKPAVSFTLSGPPITTAHSHTQENYIKFNLLSTCMVVSPDPRARLGAPPEGREYNMQMPSGVVHPYGGPGCGLWLGVTI